MGKGKKNRAQRSSKNQTQTPAKTGTIYAQHQCWVSHDRQHKLSFATERLESRNQTENQTVELGIGLGRITRKLSQEQRSN
jgi:hypothetical protein